MTSAHQHSAFSSQDHWIQRIAQRIRRSLELEVILNTTTAEIQQFLQIDRVKIYQFHADGSGRVVAEYLGHDHRLPSLYGLNFPADDIPPETRRLYREARIRTVVDVATRQIGQCRLYDRETDEPLAADWVCQELDPCHAEYLTTMGVRATLVAPILHQDHLWGLLVAHHTQPKVFTDLQVQGIQLVIEHLSIAIAQSSLLQQTREKARREAALSQVTALLQSLNTVELQQALEATVAALSGSGGRLLIQSEQLLCPEATNFCRLQSETRRYTCGSQPHPPAVAAFSEIEQSHAVQHYFQSGDRPCWAMEDLYQIPALRNLQAAFHATAIRGWLLLPLVNRQHTIGYLSIFRDEFATETLWAGQFDPDVRQSLPRQSFELWKQTQTGQTRPWTPEDLELGQALARHFATAIEQAELYQQVRQLNATLEQQVQERTAQLQTMMEQQRMLLDVVIRMRQSLDLDTMFATVTQELRRILEADRVGIYQFDSTSDCKNGKFVSEDVEGFPSAIAIPVQDYCFGDRYAQLYRQGRVFALGDVQNAGLDECFVALLQQFQIRATLVAPLLKGEELWGLICVHQCSQPRIWQPAETQFVAQVAAQVGVALEQAELLSQTQQQSRQLSLAFQDLQKTQSQLVQTEKMSSLGQLVAGVAHEINNPVNFIHGNLTYVSRYAEGVLGLLQCYQQDFPQPTARIQEFIHTLDLDFVAEDLPRTLNSMRVGTERIRQIVLSLRNFSRLDQAEMKPVDIHEGIESTLMILHHRLKATPDHPAIQLVKEYGDLPLVECYAGQLNQVFMNILSNAIDELEEQNHCRPLQQVRMNPGMILIQTEKKPPGQVLIRIADNGKGMSEEVRRRLFDPFFTTKPLGKGTGLGLSISYQIVVEKHGGKLDCLSELGQGTEFRIEIPVRQP